MDLVLCAIAVFDLARRWKSEILVSIHHAHNSARYHLSGDTRNYSREVISLMALTAAQVWYVAIVYPERVSASEASDAYDNFFAMTEADRSYWQTAADVLNDLALLEPSSK